MTGIHFNNYLQVVTLVVLIQILGKIISSIFEMYTIDTSIPDPKNKRNEYTFPVDYS